MSAQQILALVQVGKFALEVVETYQQGDMTEEQLANAWQQLRDRLDDANTMWEEAGGENT